MLFGIFSIFTTFATGQMIQKSNPPGPPRMRPVQPSERLLIHPIRLGVSSWIVHWRSLRLRYMPASGEHQPLPIGPGGPARRALHGAANAVGARACEMATRRPKGRHERLRRSVGMVFAMCTSMLLSQAGPAESVDLMHVFRPQRQSQGLPVSVRPTVPCVRRSHVSARHGQQVARARLQSVACCPSRADTWPVARARLQRF